MPSQFSPTRWLKNPHLQTILPSFVRATPKPVELHREILQFPDGDETAIDWAQDTGNANSPLLIILHGLESSAQSSYAQMLLAACSARGWDACVMNFRDCGDYRNKLARRYHAGETGDIGFFVEQQRLSRQGPILLVGYSLGGNVLLKYLGEAARQPYIKAAVGVCVPLDLQACSTALQSGASRIYQRYLLRNMRAALRDKFTPESFPFDWNRAIQASTFDEFDDAVTAPLHGFASKDDYYAKSSSKQYLKSIDTPTLVINALDDPFMHPAMLPLESELAANVTLELSPHGGHVGFIESGIPGRWQFYLPTRIIEFLASRL